MVTKTTSMTADEYRQAKGIERILRTTVIGAVLILAVWIFKNTLLLIFAAVLISCGLRGASDALSRITRIGPRWSLFLVIIILVLMFSALIWWRGDAIAAQAVLMADEIQRQGQRLWQNMQQSSWGAWVARGLRDEADTAGKHLNEYLTGVASSTLGISASIVIVAATALFLSISPKIYVDGSLRLLPPRWRPRGREILACVGRTLQLWILGQLFDMAVVAIFVGTGLFILGVSLAPTLALIAGLLNFVPYIGALAGAIPAIMVAFSQSPELALWVTLLFVTVQTLEGNVIAPLIQRWTVSLPPALTIVSQTILGTLFGVVGIILATPLMAASLVAVRMVYVETILEGDGTAASQR